MTPRLLAWSLPPSQSPGARVRGGCTISVVRSKTAPQVGRASAVMQRDNARALPPALVEYNAEVLHTLIALRWLSEDEAYEP